MALFDTIRGGASGAVSFNIDRSLRFDNVNESYLTRTPSSSGNRRTWTLSLWIKRSSIEIHNSANAHVFMDARGSVETTFGFDSDDRFYMDIPNRISTTAKFRDVTAWQHWVIAVDTTQSSESNRVKLYVNGVQLTEFDNNSRPSQNYETGINLTQAHQIGRYDNGGHFDGYMTEINLIDGQQLTPTSFAETDSTTNEWIPIDTSSLTFGTNGFRLQFLDNSGTSATTLGKDTSGNGNNYTPNNLSVSAGQNNDSLEDTPTNNYPTLNFTNSKSPSRIRNGALDINFTDGDDNDSALATFGMESGKYYFEILLRAGSSSVLSSLIGIAPDSYQKLKKNIGESAWAGKDTDSGVGMDGSGAKYIDGSSSTYGSSFTTNDIVGVAVDADAAKVAFSKNGQFSDGNGNFNQGANVASGGQVSIDGTAPYFLAVADTSGSRDPKFTLNFGQRAFSYSIPSGYQKLNSQNLPSCAANPSIEYFDSTLWTGNGSSQNITGFNFSPDWVWGKPRSTSHFHTVVDTVRGAGNLLFPNVNNGEETSATAITAFLSNGFTVGSQGNALNNNGETYVGWVWDAGSSTSTNSTGSISAQVRANATAGISICTWTGTGSNGSIGHGLGVTPNFCLMKRRDTGGNNWIAASFDMQSARELNTSNAFSDGDYDAFFPSQPTSSVINMATDSNNNTSGGTYVGYIFSSVQGFSKFGTYEGNGNSNGSYIFTGFRPAFLIIKRTDSGNHWCIYDVKRSTVNVVDDFLAADDPFAESTNNSQMRVDFLAAGFKLRSGFDIVNAGSGTYFYWAIAENPFKNARAR